MQQHLFDQIKDLGVLVLNHAQIDHGDDRGVAVCQHFNIGHLCAWLLRLLLQDLRDAGEVGRRARVVDRGLSSNKFCELSGSENIKARNKLTCNTCVVALMKS